MAKYVTLYKLTAQGIRDIKNGPARARKATAAWEARIWLGGSWKGGFQGRRDERKKERKKMSFRLCDLALLRTLERSGTVAKVND